MLVEPLHIHISETDVLIDGKSVPWFVRAAVRVEIFPQDHEGGDNGGVVWLGIPAHDITVDPNAKFVTVEQQKGCLGGNEHDNGESCKTAEQQLAQWRASHVHGYAPARDI
jgi:hypothetical protein